ncbi:MAG: hypothetical protein JSR27_05175 [Proteobacteria bacterium]|nr:hypothetical protein [Pseudomonadota bacterium]
MLKTCVAALGVAGLLATFSVQAITADELIAKNAAARGGQDKIEAIKTLKFEGKLRVSGGFGAIELGLVQYEKAPDSVRTEATVQGLTQVQAWDGHEAWQISPFQGRRDAERMSADDAKSLADDAPITGALIDYKAKGSRVEYQGTEDVEGTNAYKLKVTLANGDIKYVYLDPDHYLEIRTISQVQVRGTENETTTDFGDYEQVAGVYFPFSITAQSKDGGGTTTTISIDTGEANVAIADSLFAFPAPAKVKP